MNKEKTPKHHRICMKCRVQSTGKSVKECEESFPRCGLNGGVPNDACKTTILQDGQKIFELIKVVDLAKLQEEFNSQEERIKKLENDLKAPQNTGTTAPAETITASTSDTIPKETPAATKNTPKKDSKKQTNSKKL